MALGTLFADVEILVGGGPAPVTFDVPVDGTAVTPVLEFSPEVAREGRVVFLRGSGFLPGVPVTLDWDAGAAAAPEVVPDADGGFEAPLVIFKGFRSGIRSLTVSMPTIPDGAVRAPDLLVMQGTSQPPGFGVRN
jgi:hypothetical protein